VTRLLFRWLLAFLFPEFHQSVISLSPVHTSNKKHCRLLQVERFLRQSRNKLNVFNLSFYFVEMTKFYDKHVRLCCVFGNKVERCFDIVAGVDGALRPEPSLSRTVLAAESTSVCVDEHEKPQLNQSIDRINAMLAFTLKPQVCRARWILACQPSLMPVISSLPDVNALQQVWIGLYDNHYSPTSGSNVQLNKIYEY